MKKKTAAIASIVSASTAIAIVGALLASLHSPQAPAEHTTSFGHAPASITVVY